MAGSRKIASALCIFVMLYSLQISGNALSSNRSSEAAFSTAPMTSFSMKPIGIVDSLNNIIIDGRQSQGGQLIWGGEIVQTPSGSSAKIRLDDSGQVTLLGNSAVRISTLPADPSSSEKRPALLITLESGDITVRLSPGTGVLVQALDSTYSASQGAAFRMKMIGDKPVIDIKAGKVSLQTTQSQPRYLLRPLDLGATTSVKARSTRQIQFQVTDENDKPIPDVPLIFTLIGVGQKAIGTLSAGTVTGTNIGVLTNAQGIATVSLQTYNQAGSNVLSVVVQDTKVFWTGQLNVPKPPGFWSAKHTLLILGVAAAAGTGTFFALQKTQKKSPIAPTSTIVNPH